MTVGGMILAFVAGAVAGYLVAALRSAARIQAVAEERARAVQQAERVPVLEARIEALSRENTGLQARLAELAKEKETETDKTAWLKTAQSELRDAFQALASDALKGNSEQFAGMTREQFVQPLEKGLKALDEQVRRMEERREGAYQSLDAHLSNLKDAYERLRNTTTSLATALTTSSGARGEWGEVQMRRIVELAGMLAHVDFEEQSRTDSSQPDMTVRLPNGGVLPVDAKTTLKTYLDVMESSDTAARKSRLVAHASAVRGRIRELAGKEYWKQFDKSPDFVVMFLPHEAFLGVAIEADADILNYAFSQRVLPATPITLLALLKTVAYAWQQQQMTENAREIAVQAKELAERLSVFIAHLQKVGKNLESTVKSYNEATGSLQARVLPSVRRLKDYGASDSEVPEIEAVDRLPMLPANSRTESERRSETEGE